MSPKQSARRRIVKTRPSILVIESDAALSSLLTVLLEREGFRVHVLSDVVVAKQLIEELKCRSYAAIIVQLTPFPSPVDPSMPTGIALVHCIAAASPECLQRTFVLTTMKSEFTAELRELCTVITEPFDIAEFVQTIRPSVAAPAPES